MSRTRIVKGIYTKISQEGHNMYSNQNINTTARNAITETGAGNGVSYGEPKDPPKPPILDHPEPFLNGDIIFCNGYLSNPKKNFESYLNVIADKVPDDVKEKPLRGANMSEKRITDEEDIMTNDELALSNDRGGGALFAKKNYEKSKNYRWLFAAKEQFEGYWEGYDNVSGRRYSQILKEYFHAQFNAHFINGSHGLQSSGSHRVEHGIAQGYAWAKQKWNIREKSEIDRIKEKKPGALTYTPQYKPVTVIGHSQGAAIAAGVALGVIYYAYELGWDEIPINILFLGTHQPQGLNGQDYENFKKYYFEDFINEWVLEWIGDIFSKEKLRQNQGIYEKMNELTGDSSWGGLIKRAVQFTFPNDRALFVTRMGDIPYVKNACNEKDNLYVESWGYYKGNSRDGFFSEEGYHFPKRLLDKAFNPDGSPNEKGHTFRQCVKEYWKAYHHYKNYRNETYADPKKKYTPASYPIPKIGKILPLWFQDIMMESIAKKEGIKMEIYMKSELYRRKLHALLAFAKVHEMELQAHFAPVGLMFNKGVLADWEQYQDQTIWDRIHDAGKDIFYKVHYENHPDQENKKKQEKAYVEGEGKNRLIKTSIANTPEIKKWIDRAKEEIKVEKHWYSNIVDWFKGNKEYDGSGWGHGARREFAEAIGLTDGNIDSIIEAGFYSMLQAGEIDISNSDRLIRKINQDLAFINYEKEIAELILNSPQYLSNNFEFNYRKGIQLGGKRSTEKSMWEQFKNPFNSKNLKTWKVAINELSWLLRSIGLQSSIYVKKDGTVTIKHKFEDQFDLRPSSNGERIIEYDVACIITGFLYHDIAGGNDHMKIKGNWSNSYSKEQIDWKVNSIKRIEDAMHKMKDKIEQDRLKWIRDTR